MDKNNYAITDYNVPLIYNRADPFVCRDLQQNYYFTASVPEYDRIILRTARSVKELATAFEKIIWRKHESGSQSVHIWAPELHYVFGKWYIYYAAGNKADKWCIRPHVLECDSPDPMTGNWMELGMMKAAEGDDFSFRDFSLDATVFEHQGTYYYIWAEKTGGGKKISNLYIAKMKSANQLSTVQVLLTTPDYKWERVGFWVNEGPAILKFDGKIYLFFSASETGSSYCMGMIWCDENADLCDPQNWTKERKPILCTDVEKGIYGPGHCSFVKNEIEDKYNCVYHARQYDEITGDPLYDPNRHVMIGEVILEAGKKPIINMTKRV